VSPVRYELGFYIPEVGTLHSHRHENHRFTQPLSSLLYKAAVSVTIHNVTCFTEGRRY
jgi:hypothetical protein